jgi:hypothetical protein
MKNISRRAILKTLAVASAAATSRFALGQNGEGSAEERRATLNVVLHGLFVMVVKNICLELFTPNIATHIYKAGPWDYRKVRNLENGYVYRLSGVDYRSSLPNYESEFKLEFPQALYKFTLRPEYSALSIQLPFPETIRFVRCVDQGPNSPTGSNPYEIRRLSLCQVLSYSAADYQQLKLSYVNYQDTVQCKLRPGERTHRCRVDWTPEIDEETGTTNLHLWAEPELRLTPQHAIEAYDALSAMIAPLRLTLRANTTAPLDRDTGICGLAPEEEQGWSEWQNAGEGSYPTNCGGIVIR